MVGVFKMIQAVLLVAAGLAAGATQPLGCTEDFQCNDGYCDKDTHHCAQCLQCEDFNRNPPATPIACITSVSDCGSCYEGLVENEEGNLLEKCSAGAMFPSWVWAVIAVCGALLLIAAVAIVIYALRNTQTFRILASTRASVQSPCGSSASASAPSAPEPPPPYNTLYSPVRPDSPPASPPAADESAAPFLKPSSASEPARETAGSQAANVYHNPAYVRGPHLPNDYFTAEREEEPEYLHDETTAESPWAPTDVATSNATNDMSSSVSGSTSASAESSGAAGGSGSGGGGGGGVPALLAVARTTTLVRPPRADVAPPAKLPRLRQDTNNNRNNRDDDDDEAMSRSSGGPTFNIHINVNDIKL